MIDVDTVIVGAGPAGSAAARILASSGASVALIDKVAFPRDKYCGDGLTTLALRELDRLDFDPSTVPSWQPVHGARLRSPAGRNVDVPLPTGPGTFAAIARRSELDAALVDHAREAGADCRFGAALVSIEPGRESVVVGLDDGTSITTTQCLAADGMWSPTRKLLGLAPPGYRGEWHAFRQYFTDVDPAADALWVWFEPDLLPGYAWSFPLGDGSVNVGFGILRGGSISTQQMKRLWPDLLSRPHIAEVLGPRATPEAPHKAWPIPARIDRAPLTGPRTMFIGDAAMACDPLTGEGIGQALVTARVAAESIMEGGREFERVRDRYEADVRAHLVADHRMAVGLGKLLTRQRVAEMALRTVDSTAWARRNFGRWMFEDYPRAIVATPRRWHRGALHQPGAYVPDAGRRPDPANAG